MLISKIKERIANLDELVPRADRSVLLSCLGIALFCWFILKMSKEYYVAQDIHITYSLPEGKVAAATLPAYTKAYVKARGWNLLPIELSNKSWRVEMALTPKDEYFQIGQQALKKELVPLFDEYNLELSSLDFEYLQVEVQNRAVKRVPIHVPSKVNFDGEYGFAKTLELTPDSVTITGAEKDLRNIAGIESDSLLMSGVKNSFSRTLKLPVLPNGLQLSVPDVTVSGTVERFTEKKIYVDVSVVKTNIKDSISVFPNKVLLSFLVSLGQFDAVEADDFEVTAYITPKHIAEGAASIPLNISHPDLVRRVKCLPQSVSFLVVD